LEESIKGVAMELGIIFGMSALLLMPLSFSQEMAMGFDLTARKGEITPAIESTFLLGHYMLIGPRINATCVFQDPNNDGKVSVSYAGGAMLLAMMAGSVFHVEEVGSVVASGLQFLIIVPLIIDNSEHHFSFVYRDSLGSMTGVFPSVFVGTKTDLFSHWYRFSAETGVQFDFPFGNGKYILGLRCGVSAGIVRKGDV
jgi:hypothetical protein